MNKYDQVYEMVTRFTDSPTLRVFFTLYLMASSEIERQTLNERLWVEVGQLAESEQKAIKIAMDLSFDRLPAMVRELHDKVIAATQITSAHA
ncbi:MAG: hypothetical protein LH618_00795 [Saprospiraceae bacterium]|nr:hypothetical protein [Saprospiraceae bacterium]